MAGLRIAYQLVAPLDRVIGPGEVERRRAYLQAAAAPGVTVTVHPATAGYPSIESERDAVAVSPHILAGLQRAEAEGAAAGIVGCFSDPALDASRETMRMPVVGPGQASVMLALQLGERFSILSPQDTAAKRQWPRLRAQGVEARLASVRGVGVSVLDLARGEAGMDRLAAVGRACIERDGADVLVMGCMSMAFMGVDVELSKALGGTPVVNPVLAALKTAEMLLALRLSHARTAWPSPPEKPFYS